MSKSPPASLIETLLAIAGNGLEHNPFRAFAQTSRFQPLMNIFALANVKSLKLVAAVHNGVNASARNSHTSSYGEFAKIEQMKSKATQRRVRDSRAAKREIQVGQLRASESQDLGCRIRKGTTKGLWMD